MTTTAPTNNRRPIVITVVAILVAVTITWVAIVAYLLTRPADQPTNPTETLTARGIINLPDEYSRALDPGDPCHVTRNPALTDIAEGAQVAITSNTGTTLAVGHLDAGTAATYEMYPDQGAICTFAFTIPNVPTGQGPYGVTVGVRDINTYTEAELAAGLIELTID